MASSSNGEKTTVPPYCTYGSFKSLINGLRENGMPSHLSRSVLPGSNSAKATMASSLKSAGLIDSHDTPTQKMRQLVDPAQDYAKSLREILDESYAWLFDAVDLKTTTTEKVEEQFKLRGASGSTVSKCMAFFLSAAKETGIEVSQYVKAPIPPRANRNRRGGTNSRADGAGHPAPTPPPSKPQQKTVAEMLLEKFPEFDPEWPDELKTKWFESFTDLRKSMLKDGDEV